MNMDPRVVVVIVATCVSAGLLPPGAVQAAPASCDRFVPTRALRDDGGRPRTESLDAPVIPVSDAATKSRPVVRTYEHGPGKNFPFYLGPEIVNEHKYFNFQVTTTRPARGLYIRIDWATPSISDIDLFLMDPKGALVGYSDATNWMPNEVEQVVADALFPRPINGGPGFESILGVPARRCAGFMLDSQVADSLGERVRLTAWLGEIRRQD
jgi:hypothetical protein